MVPSENLKVMNELVPTLNAHLCVFVYKLFTQNMFTQFQKVHRLTLKVLTVTQCFYSYLHMTKQRLSQMKRYIGQCLGGPRVQELLSPLSGVPQPPSTYMCSLTCKAPQTPYYWDFREAFSYRHDQLLTPFLAPLLSLKNGEMKLKTPKILILTGSFWWPAPTQEPSRDPPRVASLEQKTLLVLSGLQNLQGF